MKEECEEVKGEFTKNILSSSHINFLFGAGVNGSALPQLGSFETTLNKIKELGGDISGGLEEGIDTIEDEDKREDIKQTFIEEFKKYHEDSTSDDRWEKNSSIKNIENLFRLTYSLVHETQNRNPSMKQINVYTLNYDIVIEKTLTKLGYLFNEISASNTAIKAALLDVIGYDYKIKKYIPTYMISKLHGDIDKPIIPGKEKYKDILNENYFEIVFNMKEQLCRENSILIVIGYSGRDNHINKILQDCINAGLIIYWFKYQCDDYVPLDKSGQLHIREQDDYNNKVDTTLLCYKDMERAWDEK